MNIVLLEPQIPQNTGSISRTCVATDTSLHLIKPLGFSIKDKAIKRAGLDYWDLLDLHIYDSYEEFIQSNPNCKVYMSSTKADKNHTEVSYNKDDYIMFGKETAGIPENILKGNYENCVRIPMKTDIRSLNISNAVSIVLYEALRQNDFMNLSNMGKLTNKPCK